MSHLLVSERIQIRHGFAQIKVWELDAPIPPNAHRFKYRLAYLEGERVRVLYDTHTGKADHKHIDEEQCPYAFRSLDALAADFFADIEELPE